MTNIPVSQLQSNNLPQEMIENRLRAISINAVREARIVFSREDKPFLDDDARRAEMIFNLLHLATIDQINEVNEHYPVVAKNQAPKNLKLEKVEQILSEIGNEFRETAAS